MYGNIDLGNLFKEINRESIAIALQKDNGRKGSGVFTEITGTQEGNDLFALTAQIENELTDIDKGTQLLANSIITANKEMFNTKESQQLSYDIIASEAYALGIACADISSEDFMDKVKELKNNTIALIERIVRWIKNKISEISDNISVWVSTARANTESKVKKLKEYKEKINKLSSPVPSTVSFEEDISDMSKLIGKCGMMVLTTSANIRHAPDLPETGSGLLMRMRELNGVDPIEMDIAAITNLAVTKMNEISAEELNMFKDFNAYDFYIKDIVRNPKLQAKSEAVKKDLLGPLIDALEQAEKSDSIMIKILSKLVMASGVVPGSSVKESLTLAIGATSSALIIGFIGKEDVNSEPEISHYSFPFFINFRNAQAAKHLFKNWKTTLTKNELIEFIDGAIEEFEKASFPEKVKSRLTNVHRHIDEMRGLSSKVNGLNEVGHANLSSLIALTQKYLQLEILALKGRLKAGVDLINGIMYFTEFNYKRLSK